MDCVYVMLSGILAAKGRWDDVEKVRASMANRGIKKEPGGSWAKTDTQVGISLLKIVRSRDQGNLSTARGNDSMSRKALNSLQVPDVLGNL
ncbi:hypothetical protein Vadar_022410 [Vaccinium darrowii]|uniref:Uncharacterized protein n=1 Tax=Vaccinium darrowii TaxID=229202 RepID=A0ACB7YFT4_9ERIC|nr:hypothetical protein Vadar_022410 [Vaccinium darrowii]